MANSFCDAGTMSSASQELSNYDFVEQPPGEFYCLVTRKLLLEPFQTACCGNHLTEEAVQQIKRDSKACPHCNQSLKQIFFDRSFKRRVENLQVHCSKKGAGCSWMGELGSLDRHLSNGLVGGQCQYVAVACPNLCGRRLQRRNLERHKANDCPKRQFTCMHCTHGATYQKIVEDHWPKCSKYPLECPNNCGKRSIERQHLPNHLKVCPLQLVECEFDYAGCRRRIQRQGMQSHVDSSMQVHLQMVARHAKLQETRIEQLEEKMGMLTAEFNLRSTALEVFIPPPVFTMTNFEQHKMDEDQWFSPPFYSHIGGYKMCISVFGNGSEAGNGTHVSVLLHIMRGEYDDNLKWPFHGEVTVQLLNQRRSAKHQEEALIQATDCSLDRFKSCAARVEGLQHYGPGWGHDKFISHGKLGYNVRKNRQYLMNDCLKFQVNKIVVQHHSA